VRLRFIQLDEVETQNGTFASLKSAGKGGIAHVGLSDLLRLEQYLVPAIKDNYFSAYYFAVGGLANWPRILIDGFATSYFQSYRNLSLTEARTIALRRARYIILGIIFVATLTLPILGYFSSNLLGSRYSNYLWIYYFMTLTVAFNSGRRLILDYLRIASDQYAKKASNYEALAGSFQLVGLLFLLLDVSLMQWSIVAFFFSLVSFCLLTLFIPDGKGRNY
jgi:hypothetical protein